LSERVLLFEEALGEVLAHAAGLVGRDAGDSLGLLEARGRILRRAVVADRNQPPFARSTRDGFAVRSGDLRGDAVTLRLLGGVRAGERWEGPAVQEGEAVEIMTGAPLPEGADCVLMVEHAVLDGQEVRPEVGRRLRAGENVVQAAAEAREGTELLPAGRRVGTPEVSLAASCGLSWLEVYPQPRVAVAATGDELVEVGEAAEVWQIRNSNSYTLASLVEGEGGVAERLAIARDTREDLQARLSEARRADLVLFSGGVSMGKYDLVEEVLREAGAEFLFTGAKIQPGKPVVFGRLPKQVPGTADTQVPHAGRGASGSVAGQSGAGWTYFFGLPGNPISTEVCFRLFVAPVLRALCGETALAPRFAEARLAEEVRGGARVTRFLPAVVEGDWRGVQVRLVPWQGSGDLAANARANGFVVLPLGVETFRAGETVRVLLR
jgi:molybdopterin molybdotransferase